MKKLYEACHSLSNKYATKTIGEIAQSFGEDEQASFFTKSVIHDIINKMLVSIIPQIEVETHKRVLLKIIGTTVNGKKKFDNKLFMVDFDNLLNPAISFSDSQFSIFFSNHVFLYALYEFPHKPVYNQSECVFLGFKAIEFGQTFIETEVQRTWTTMRETILNGRLKDIVALDKYGDPFINSSGTIRSAPNFPKSSDGVVFIRGGGSDATVKPLELNGVRMYQQFVWLRGDYVLKRLLKEKFL